MQQCSSGGRSSRPYRSSSCSSSRGEVAVVKHARCSRPDCTTRLPDVLLVVLVCLFTSLVLFWASLLAGSRLKDLGILLLVRRFAKF